MINKTENKSKNIHKIQPPSAQKNNIINCKKNIKPR